MRFLFTSRPFLGHVYPMVPLARALVTLGHQVELATTARFLDELADLGLDGFAAGLDPLLPEPERDGRAAPEGGYGVDVVRSKAEDIIVRMQRTSYDVVVREPTDFAGMLAAEAVQVPHLTLGRSQFVWPSFWRDHVGWALELVREELGLPPDPALDGLFGSCYLDTVPSWFQPPNLQLPASRVEISPYPFDGYGVVPAMRPDAPAPVGIYVTFGTVYNRDHSILRSAVAAARSFGRPVTCTVGTDQDPDEVVPERTPDVYVRRFVPASTVLPHTAVVVCHGGYSTVMGALCTGVPLVVVPRGSDQLANARQCERLGVGIAVTSQSPPVEELRSAIGRVLDEPAYAANARTLAEDAVARTPIELGAQLTTRAPDLYRLGLDVTGQLLLPRAARTMATSTK